ncbi:MAG: exodeoxyribonuclease VII large subunit [Clostridia bacterium]|nr:exodeoxyribonuclease VII large subunit [Clostridia bacterium]
MNDTISVSQFNNYVKQIFDAEELLHNIKIVGEVFGVSKSKSAVYFSVKDENATLPCVTFFSFLFDEIKEGETVIVTGSPNFYTKQGKFNFIVNKIEQYGLGLLYQRFVELKNKLESEGLFDQAHKKAIPSDIKRIGVITSKEGAVIQDIINVTRRRNNKVDIVLFPTKVQGNGAECEIAHAIDRMSEYEGIDVVVVARGGGSMEDLAAYNTEIVARATYNCKKPIVSAVGHETDYTIIDFVSDLRAPTPSAAAELLTIEIDNEKSKFIKIIKNLANEINNYIVDKQIENEDLKNSLLDNIETIIDTNKNRLDKLEYLLSNNSINYINNLNHKFNLLETSLNKLDPMAIMNRGYAKIEQSNKSISNINEIDFNNDIEIYMKDGMITSKPIRRNI